jgi:hypothetical protein
MDSHLAKIFAWLCADKLANYDPGEVRVDRYGAIIIWSHYGNRQSQFGWELDHKIPVSRGGTDSFFNLQVLHWKNNLTKSDY